MLEGTIRRTGNLLEAQVQDELVALDPRAGKCFGFNPVAADIWRMLERPMTFAELKRELLERYEVAEPECSEDLQDVLSTMRSAGLIDGELD